MPFASETDWRRGGSYSRVIQSQQNVVRCRRGRGDKNKYIEMMKTQNVKTFAWQTGYGAFSVSRSNIGTVEDYIRRQKEHHSKQDFKNEFRGLLKKHDVEFDERYVWD